MSQRGADTRPRCTSPSPRNRHSASGENHASSTGSGAFLLTLFGSLFDVEYTTAEKAALKCLRLVASTDFDIANPSHEEVNDSAVIGCQNGGFCFLP